MQIYIDNNYKCYISNNDNSLLRTIETDFFDSKCKNFIEGYRYIPEGESFEEDGTIFFGEMISPWKDYDIILKYQEIYEEMKTETASLEAENEDMKNALNILLGEE